MANAASNTGLGGVSGTRAAGLPSTATGALGTSSYSAAGTLNVQNRTAVRKSPSRTQRSFGTGNQSAFSAVYSETQGLRVGYAGQEVDYPAITRS